jgi:carbamoyltransferase
MKILGFNPSHHGSVCLLEDGELKFFIQEERLTRKKYHSLPFKSFLELINTYEVDCIAWGSPGVVYPVNNLETSSSYWTQLFFHHTSKNLYSIDFSTAHHVCHISHAFYNSGFEKSIGVVIDGVGSIINGEDIGQETETIFECSYPEKFRVLYKNIQSYKNQNINLSKVYETITMHLGWSRDEAGKTMGLSSYGTSNLNIPDFFISNQSNPNIFYLDVEKTTLNPNQDQTFINEEKNPQLKLPRDPREWHYDESKITDLEKDLAWKVQNDTQQLVGDYIEKAIQETGLKQVCCAGGYFLNCVTNYYLLKRFPDIEFYFEPIANDAGTAIGAAKLAWHSKTQDTTIRPFKSLYLGKQYSKEELLEGIKKYVDTP